MLVGSALFLQLITLALASKRPIIGILSQEKYSSSNSTSYIAASYVKAVEQSGARVVPIFINKTEQYYKEILDSVNGVVFPGGGAIFTDQGGYGDAGRIIFDYTKKVNAEGDNFPLLGICLGFELMFFLEQNSYKILDYCDSINVALPLIFKTDYKTSKLFRTASRNIISTLEHPTTYNHHRRCVTEILLKRFHLNKAWHVLSISLDKNGKEFISTVEHYKYPIVGLQFHPEKNAFEWNPTVNIVHSEKAIHSSRYIFDWFVNEAKKNNHVFGNKEEEKAALIYNFSPTFEDDYYEQCYNFCNDSTC